MTGGAISHQIWHQETSLCQFMIALQASDLVICLRARQDLNLRPVD